MKGEVPIPVLANYFRVPYPGGIPVDYPGRDVLLQSRITNISKNGVFVVTANPLPQGSQFEIHFQVPGTQQSIRAECVVRWSSEAKGGGSPSGMGLEFTRIARKDRKTVDRMIKDFLTEMRRKGAEIQAPKITLPGPNESAYGGARDATPDPAPPPNEADENEGELE